jgi:hypothetical protein
VFGRLNTVDKAKINVCTDIAKAAAYALFSRSSVQRGNTPLLNEFYSFSPDGLCNFSHLTHNTIMQNVPKTIYTLLVYYTPIL